MNTPTTPIDKETAVCRGCGRELDGKPYYMGGSAYHPVTRERCPANFYGGYVCSEQCDFNASLELERSMPGHGGSQKYPGQAATNHIKQNWKK